MFGWNRNAGERGMAQWATIAAMAVFGGIAGYSLIHLRQEHNRAQELSTANQALNASLQQMRGDMQALTNRLNALTAAPPTVPATLQEAARNVPTPRPAVRTAAHPAPRSTADDQRFRRLEQKLNDQRQEIADARLDADQARQDLQTQLNSQHDELSGSIARNHDQLVALEKRGERNYYEFDLNKSKQFNRVGPLTLSLRAVNVKHKYYDLVMTVDDQQLEKKHVNLYEPLLLTVADRPQPIELVVNSIKNNEVLGYVSEPKYKKSDLAAGTPGPAPADSKTLQRR
jgi:outer membrane murein-binding lipoprotein Lpp